MLVPNLELVLALKRVQELEVALESVLEQPDLA